MKRLFEHSEDIRASIRPATVYVDLDGTLLGPGGSLFATIDGTTVEAARGISALLEAGIDLVLTTGRTRDTVRHVARLVGATAYIAEIGGLVVYRTERDERVVRNVGSFSGAGTPYGAIERSGAGGLLLEAYGGRLEPHAPWAFLERECSMLFRGHLDIEEAVRFLADAGYGWLDLLDNGLIHSPPGRFPGLNVERVHAYHLVPAGVSKRSAVAIDRSERGLDPERCVAIGDSASDVDMASEVGAVFVVANGEAAVGGLALPENVYLTGRAHGEGFAEAVFTMLGR